MPVSRSAEQPASRCSEFRLAMAMLAPSVPRRRAIARPIPVPPPVITATRPFSRLGSNIALDYRC